MQTTILGVNCGNYRGKVYFDSNLVGARSCTRFVGAGLVPAQSVRENANQD